LQKYLDILKKYWGYDGFREKQDEIVKSIASGKDTLGLLPTGGGKSITFQVPAMMMDGVCIVITPLVALMKDQVANLQNKGIKALAVFNGLSNREINIAYDNCIYGDYKFLYMSPERLSTELFLTKLPQLKVSMLVVDEAHCISQWGYDFRPSYIKIADIRKELPEVPILALTATATPQIVDDIQDKLLFETKHVVQKSFERKNLAYIVRNVEDKLGELIKIVKAINACTVVFVRNRKKTKEYCEWLIQNGISAHYYHAGLTHQSKDKKQKEWMNDSVQVMVCTNAFGMGIDKPNVRLVVHMDAPDSLEAYFQEAGRAGRDEKKAYAVMLWNNADKTRLKRNMAVTFPEKDVINRVYQALGNYFQIAVGHGAERTFDFEMIPFAKAYGFNLLQVFNSLKILQRAEYVEYTEELNIPARLHITVGKSELYHLQVSNSNFDAFLKLLLRSYTGFWTDYVAIDEQTLAKRANVPLKTIFTYLNQLSKMKVVHYIPRKKTPQVFYVQDREEQRFVKLPNAIYKDRKADFEKRVSAVINYSDDTHMCRSQFLLQYFGDKKAKSCGQCDVCIDKKKKGINADDLQELEQSIKEFLQEPKSILELTAKFSGQKQWESILDWLIDNEIIYQNEEDKWCMK